MFLFPRVAGNRELAKKWPSKFSLWQSSVQLRPPSVSLQVSFFLFFFLLVYRFLRRCRPWPSRDPDSSPSKRTSPTGSRTVSYIGVWLTAGISTQILCALPYSSSMVLGSKLLEYITVLFYRRQKTWTALRGQREEREVCAAAYRNYVTFPLLQLVPYTLIQKEKNVWQLLISKRKNPSVANKILPN